MEDRFAVYHIQFGQLYRIIEKCFEDPHFDILSLEEKNIVYDYIVIHCSGKYYNQNRLRYYIRHAVGLVDKSHTCEILIDILVKSLINTDLSIGELYSEDYKQLLIEDRKLNKKLLKHKNELNINYFWHKLCFCFCVR